MNPEELSATFMLNKQGEIHRDWGHMSNVTEHVHYLNAQLDEDGRELEPSKTTLTHTERSEPVYIDMNEYRIDKTVSIDAARAAELWYAKTAKPQPQEEFIQKLPGNGWEHPATIDVLKKMIGTRNENIQRYNEEMLRPVDPFDVIKQKIAAMPKVTNSESQKRALALLLLQKLMKLLGI